MRRTWQTNMRNDRETAEATRPTPQTPTPQSPPQQTLLQPVLNHTQALRRRLRSALAVFRTACTLLAGAPLLAGALLLAGATPVVAAPSAPFSVQIIRGPSSHVALVELFTSEGCSSCPPADRWLSGLTQDKRLWRDIVPLAFHVDYWDQLGWRDRFSSAANTDRQRRLAAAGNANGVYTPGFFFDANEWRGFFRSAPLPSTHIASPGPLTISIGGDSAVVSYQGDAAANGASTSRATRAHLALLGFGISTNVQNGENGGHTLRHDFVVLASQQQPLNAGTARFNLTLPPTAAGASRLALVSWITPDNDEQAIQAAGGWLTTKDTH